MIQRVRGFPPIIATGARVLILGSMPSQASLQARRYYAHPRNQFWPILGELLGFDPRGDYALRVLALQRAGIAVWDVLAECVRPGSMDHAIDRNSERPNDIIGLLAAYPSIRCILLNGRKAESSLLRHVPEISIERITLPSTSPAHAAMSAAEKSIHWHRALRAALEIPAAQPHLE